MGVGIVREKLEAVITIDASIVRARGSVGNRAGGYRAGLAGTDNTSIAIGAIEHNRIARASQTSLDARARFAQMDGVRSNISHFENPILRERVLDGKIPLLCVGRYVFARHGQAENKLRWQYTRAGASATVVRRL